MNLSASLPAGTTCDAFLGGRLEILQPQSGYRAGVDPVLLAAAVPALTGQTILELGCGVGVASLCLAARVPGVKVTGIELLAENVALACANGARNRLAFDAFEGDVAALPKPVSGYNFDHVFANPPYFLRQDGPSSDRAQRECAMGEATPLKVWIDTATRRLRPGGSLTVILAAERVPDLFAALDGRLGGVQLLPVAGRTSRPAGRVILRARKGRRDPFRMLAPLVLHKGPRHDGDRASYVPEIHAVLREAAALPGFDD